MVLAVGDDAGLALLDGAEVVDLGGGGLISYSGCKRRVGLLGIIG